MGSTRQKVAAFVRNAVKFPGFEPIEGLSSSFLSDLAHLSLDFGNQNDSMATKVAYFLSRVLVSYRLDPAFILQKDYSGVQAITEAGGQAVLKVIGLKDSDISASALIKLVDLLVSHIVVIASAPANNVNDTMVGPFVILHSLVKDLAKARVAGRGDWRLLENQPRAVLLKQDSFWNICAGSLASAQTWLKENPDFVDRSCMPPLRFRNALATCLWTHSSQIAEATPSDAVHEFWAWKEHHKKIVIRALGQLHQASTSANLKNRIQHPRPSPNTTDESLQVQKKAKLENKPATMNKKEKKNAEEDIQHHGMERRTDISALASPSNSSTALDNAAASNSLSSAVNNIEGSLEYNAWSPGYGNNASSCNDEEQAEESDDMHEADPQAAAIDWIDHSQMRDFLRVGYAILDDTLEQEKRVAMAKTKALAAQAKALKAQAMVYEAQAEELELLKPRIRKCGAKKLKLLREGCEMFGPWESQRD